MTSRLPEKDNMITLDERLIALLEYVRADNRVCPNPPEWHKLWELLPDKKLLDSGWDPPLPLILGAWSLPAFLKTSLLEKHIRYAAEHSALEEVDLYLRGLSDEQWFRLK